MSNVQRIDNKIVVSITGSPADIKSTLKSGPELTIQVDFTLYDSDRESLRKILDELDQETQSEPTSSTFINYNYDNCAFHIYSAKPFPSYVTCNPFKTASPQSESYLKKEEK